MECENYIIRNHRPVGYLSVKEYAFKYKVSDITVRKWIERGKIKANYIGTNAWISEDEPYPNEKKRGPSSRKKLTGSEPYVEFSERLRIALDKKGISQTKLSEETGIDMQTLSRYFNGKNLPRVKTSIELAKVLDISLDWLFGLVD